MDTLNSVQRTNNLLRNMKDVTGELFGGIARDKIADGLEGLVGGRVVDCVDALSSSNMSSDDRDGIFCETGEHPFKWSDGRSMVKLLTCHLEFLVRI